MIEVALIALVLVVVLAVIFGVSIAGLREIKNAEERRRNE